MSRENLNDAERRIREFFLDDKEYGNDIEGIFIKGSWGTDNFSSGSDIDIDLVTSAAFLCDHVILFSESRLLHVKLVNSKSFCRAIRNPFFKYFFPCKYLYHNKISEQDFNALSKKKRKPWNLPVFYNYPFYLSKLYLVKSKELLKKKKNLVSLLSCQSALMEMVWAAFYLNETSPFPGSREYLDRLKEDPGSFGNLYELVYLVFNLGEDSFGKSYAQAQLNLFYKVIIELEAHLGCGYDKKILEDIENLLKDFSGFQKDNESFISKKQKFTCLFKEPDSRFYGNAGLNYWIAGYKSELLTSKEKEFFEQYVSKNMGNYLEIFFLQTVDSLMKSMRCFKQGEYCSAVLILRMFVIPKLMQCLLLREGSPFEFYNVDNVPILPLNFKRLLSSSYDLNGSVIESFIEKLEAYQRKFSKNSFKKTFSIKCAAYDLFFTYFNIFTKIALFRKLCVKFKKVFPL